MSRDAPGLCRGGVFLIANLVTRRWGNEGLNLLFLFPKKIGKSVTFRGRGVIEVFAVDGFQFCFEWSWRSKIMITVVVSRTNEEQCHLN
ncbi:hypothetical protein NPIL_140721 [Nephila pilipes]|uniref:Uncharacterized protein n=1 Tax=Nephila pilipes TaxID=299642 RepID=A0A8X6MZV5_NEPPI|nr:hypothetical protein NPIL_140721 [Nephila pilipes]